MLIEKTEAPSSEKPELIIIIFYRNRARYHNLSMN